MSAKSKGKGKARAQPPSETSPLLSDAQRTQSYASSSQSVEPHDVISSPPPSRRSTHRYALGAIILSLSLGVLTMVGLLAVSFVPSDREVEQMPNAFKYTSPTVHVLDVSDGGVHINVVFRGGVDVDAALAVDGRRGDSWWQSVRRSAAHAVYGALPQQAVHVTAPEVLVYPRGGGLPLLNVTLPADIVIPLVRGGDLQPLSVEAIGAPVASVGEIWTWAQGAWAAGATEVFIGIREAHAQLRGAWWSHWATFNQYDLAFPVEFNVPALPNLPPPGKPLDLSSLVKLHSYSFSNTDTLRISAKASLPNPGLGEVPFPLPFAINLGETRMAEVVATASKIGEQNIDLKLEGDIVATSGDSLGDFLANFLHGKDSPVVVSGLGHMPTSYKGPAPPDFVLNTLPSLRLDLLFPAPHPPPQIVKSVTVEGMNFAQGDDGSMEASGTVVAVLQLPDGLEHIDLNVTAILPDVFIYDGPADASQDRPDPSNPPKGAFGQIHPRGYLPATTERGDGPNLPRDSLVVRAPFKNVPITILEGRQALFQSFVGKVILRGGANAGIGGVVDVRADLGTGSLFEIGDLPVTGDFWVGRSPRLAQIWRDAKNIFPSFLG